jgi:hypothetical protein
MGKTFKELKEISQGLADLVGVSYDVAASVVASFSAVGEWENVDAIAGGDMDVIKEGFKRAGAVLPDCSGSVAVNKSIKPIKANKTTEKREKPTKKQIKADLQRITPQAVEGVRVYSDRLEDYRRGELPETLADDIKSLLKAWAIDNDFDDLSKLANIQWRSACLFVGQWIKQNKILEDIERARRDGGRYYDGEKVAALVPIWEYITGLYKHIPLHVDFIAFSGVSRQWFYDYDGQGLTSTSVQIIKKVMEIENAAISVGVTDSRENPTGRIFYAKARLGWRENDTIQQIDDNNGSNKNALPVFDLPKLQ